MLKNKTLNGIFVLSLSLILLVFVECIGIDMRISFNYLPILFGILALVVFNFNLKKKLLSISNVNILIINLIIIISNLVITKLIKNYFSYISIIPILILYILFNKNKIDFSKIDLAFWKNIAIYYILPLIVLLLLDTGILKWLYFFSKNDSSTYTYLVLTTIYWTIIADAIFVVLVILINDIIDIEINIDGKKVLLFFCIVFLIIFLIRIALVNVNKKEVKNRMSTLNVTIESQDISKFYEINFDSSITAESATIIYNNASYSLNKSTSSAIDIAEFSYKLRTYNIQEQVENRKLTEAEALEYYEEYAQKYIDDLEECNQQLSMQNITFFIIYFLNILCICIVYKISNCKNIILNYE